MADDASEENLNDEIQQTADNVEEPETEDGPGDKYENEEEPRGPNILERFIAKYRANQKIAVPVTILVGLLILFAVPTTRYGVLGLVIKKDFTVLILDSATNVPVSEVELSVNGKQAKTDGEGRATLTGIKVGQNNLKATKVYYKDGASQIMVALRSPKEPIEIKIEATGRQVPLHITHKITGENLEGAQIKALGAEALTDKNGETTLVLPPDNAVVKGEVSLKGYNSQNVNITVSDRSVKPNSFQLTPEGKVYFLSKRTGKIDVMKSDLDGSNQKVVVKATGNEEEGDTVLLASRDWKYVALKSRREGKTARFYLIDTSNDQLTEIDGSNDASVRFTGWSKHNFIYQVERTSLSLWESNRIALKAYNAETGQINIVDQSKAQGSSDEDYIYEIFGPVQILSDQIVFSKSWQASYYGNYNLANKRQGIYRTYGSGSGKELLKDFPSNQNYTYIASVKPKPNQVYFQIAGARSDFYIFEGGTLKEEPRLNQDTFNKNYPTYLLSPSGQKNFWFEKRDGKNTLFVGDLGGNDPTSVANTSEYKAYGWYSDDFLLVSKNDSELFVMSVKGPGEKGQILKITNFHRPDQSFMSYGG